MSTVVAVVLLAAGAGRRPGAPNALADFGHRDATAQLEFGAL